MVLTLVAQGLIGRTLCVMLQELSSSSSVLQVMNLLTSVAYRECLAALDSAAKQSDKLPHLVHLLCSLQTSLVATCSQQLESAATYTRDETESLIVECMLLCYSVIIWPYHQLSVNMVPGRVYYIS